MTVADRLADLDAATVHEAMGREGALPSVIKPVWPDFRVCGPAFTVDCPPADNLWIHRAVYAAAPGDVLVVDCRGELEAGYWGEILSEAALAAELGGLVINGGVRDVAQLEACAFPVFAANVCIRGTIKDPAQAGRLGGSVQIGAARISTGDIVLGDRDGVVVVPRADLERVVAAAQERVVKERDVIERLRAGATTLDIYDLPKEAV
jgi:4-hydroxy-4-methyl-2-oxoglutarate aldolase